MTDLYWKTAAGILVAVVLVLVLGRQEKDLALMLSMTACALAGISVFLVLEPVLDFLYRLADLGELQQEILVLLLKITGIGLVSELAQMICKDSGNAALAQMMQLLGTAMILLLSLPVLETLLDLILQILGEL